MPVECSRTHTTRTPLVHFFIFEDFLHESVPLTDKSGFGVKRKEQIETAKKIASLPDYAKQYKLIKMLVDTIFPVRSFSCTHRT